MAFSVLFVCTANICRSVMAERLLVAELDPHLPVTVASAGVRALTGHPMDEPSAHAAADLGAGTDGHEARQLTVPMMEAGDLVLTATVEHRATALQLLPVAFRRTFTMREFARLGTGLEPLDDITGDSLRTRVAAVAARRGTVPPVPAEADTIRDPYGAPWPEVQACAAGVQDTVRGILIALGLPPMYTARHRQA